jgi:uncharacterized protein involved in exopolysaccharide biosynthesis
MPPAPPVDSRAPTVIDLGILAGAVRSRWLAIFLTGLVGAALCLTWYALSDPVYEVVTVVAPAESEVQAGTFTESLGLASLVGLSPAESVSRKDEALAMLRSRSFLYSFIEELDLKSLLVGQTSSGLKAKIPLLGQPPTMADAYDRFLEDVLSIDEERRTGLVEITVRWKDPITAASWARELLRRLNAEMQSRARERAAREMEFLQAEADRTTAVEVRQAIYRLVEHQLKAMMLANVADDFALRVIDPPIAPDPQDSVGLSAPASALLGLLGASLVSIVIVVGLSLPKALR